MNKKKILGIIVGIAAIVLLVGGIYFATAIYPKLNIGNQIVVLLQPMIEAENQSMQISVDASLNDDTIAMESDVYFLTEDEMKYLVMEQNDFPLFIADNLLLFENGKAFLLAEERETQTIEYKTMFTLMVTLFEELDMTIEENEMETSYSVMVTGEKIKSLLAAVMPVKEVFPADTAALTDGIEQLQLKVVTREEKLNRIELIGNANVDESQTELLITITDIQFLEAGAYPIPNEVKESIKNVDRDSLFNLSEDLLRLVKAIMPLTDSKNLKGIASVNIDCGPLQINTKLDLEKLKNQASANSENAAETVNEKQIKELPNILGQLAMESDIQCMKKEDSYVYSMLLDTDMMQKLAEMIAPEISDYATNLSQGGVVLIVSDEKLTGMGISIKGKVKALIVEIPVSVVVNFAFE